MGPGAPYKYLSDNELHELGEELLKWMKENKKNKDVAHLSAFYSEYKDLCRSEWKAICQRKQFLPYYEKAFRVDGSKSPNK